LEVRSVTWVKSMKSREEGAWIAAMMMRLGGRVASVCRRRQMSSPMTESSP